MMLRGCGGIFIAVVCLGAASVEAAAQVQFGPPETPPAPEIGAEAGARTEVPPPLGVESRPLGGPAVPAAGPVLHRATAVKAPEDPPARPLRAAEGWWRTAAALALVLAIIAALGAGVRRWALRTGGLVRALGAGGRAPAGLIQVLGRYPVARGQSLVLLKLGRRVLLVSQLSGARGGGMHTLCELADPEEVASILMLAADAEGRSLAARFRDSVARFEESHADAERALAPVAIAPRPETPGRDPLGSLRSRLDSLRRTDWGAEA